MTSSAAAGVGGRTAVALASAAWLVTARGAELVLEVAESVIALAVTIEVRR